MPKKSKSQLREESELAAKLAELFHERGLSLPTRTIYMGSESADGWDGETGCDAKMAERFLKNLHVLEALSPDPIVVLMNNIGGDEYHGLAIFDAIRLSHCHITVVARGHAMSMGSIILQAADKRVMGPLATQMIHYGSAGFDGHAKNFMRWATEFKRLDEWMEAMYLEKIHEKKPDFTLEQLRELLKFDTFLSAEESVALGLADEIG